MDNGARGTAADTPAAQAVSDSVELYEEILARGVARDDADAAAIAGAASTTDARVPSTGYAPGWRDGCYAELETVAGYRVSQRLNAGRSGGRLSPSVRVGARRDNGRFGGFAEIRRAGPVARVVMGGIRPKFGLGMGLGVRGVPFSSPQPARSPAADVGVAPTSSVWGRPIGGAITVGTGRHHTTAAVWRVPDGSVSAWGWWLRRSPSASFGAASGSRLGERGADGAVFVERNMGNTTLAGELSLVRGRVFASVRTVAEAAGTWDLTVFSAPAPRGYTAGQLAPGDERRRQTGGVLHRTSAWNGLSTRLTLYGSARRAGGARLLRRRLDASVNGRAGASGDRGRGTWNVAVRLEEESESEPRDDVVEYLPETSRRRRGRIRCSWTGGASSAFRQRYRLSAHADDRGGGSLVGTVAWILTLACCEATCQISNYEISSGHTGYVLRPGATGSDAVSLVSHGGTDLSARLLLRLGTLRVGAYCDRRWEKPTRWYVSARVRI
jgi:hypothetical protein